METIYEWQYLYSILAIKDGLLYDLQEAIDHGWIPHVPITFNDLLTAEEAALAYSEMYYFDTWAISTGMILVDITPPPPPPVP